MSENFDVVVIGSGHNGLVTAGYLAKAGKSVLVLEGKSFFGGGVATKEVTLPGFKHDLHSSAHLGILINPLIANDELQLKSKYGLEYIRPSAAYSTTFTDGSSLIGYNDLDRTIDNIAANASRKDADAYYKLYKDSVDFVPLAIQGMFVPPPPYGAFIALLDQSAMGRNALHELQRSPLDILNERFESDKLKIHMSRLLTEHFVDPEAKGEGGSLFMYPAFIEQYGLQTPRGGSGGLVDALIRQLEDHGAVLRANSTVVKVLTVNGKAVGVRLADGSEILAKEAVVGQIHPFNLPKLVDGIEEQTQYEISRAETATFCCVTAHYALDKAPTYVHPDINDSWLNGLCPTSLADYKKLLFDVRNGYIPKIPSLGTISTHKVDPTRAPEGKSAFLVWRIMPFKLADGSSWADHKAEVEEETLDLVDSFLPGLKASVIGKAFDTPDDIAAYSPTFQHGDVSGLASPMMQSQGHRPTPSLSQYTVPGVENLYLSGVFMHPTAGGVCGGGRVTAVKLFGDKGWDFDEVTQ
ncbi:NAD(P)/FAD-dependent oxidoreductase [Sphingobium sp. H39-3-25]|uniref:phytoene desaturase family protein n=1 Tax=Sphingomonadales TaxID=204457 RepID=UPI0008309E8E|nr:MULTISPECIES: NAD(P)/FAD-dependent oxidoreductase [Sphingomonadaceae]MDF0491080.1 NAD(P)/FAD-dependent oxidoreductase [Sphingomonas pollutisoli]MDF0545189.1 NAD(P)/FAD-dependent oxidoreductase [Sphingobium arseniciresistens]